MTENYITRGCLNRPVENAEDGKFENICKGCNKMNVFNWLDNIPDNDFAEDVVEIRFKNTRKGYYSNNTGAPLINGDVVAVEGSPGHDIGIVSLTGELVALQMKRHNAVDVSNIKKIYRKAKPNDLEKWYQAIERETEALRDSRQIVANLALAMKISDVEFQGDNTKATFYYISDERVDFRQLIKDFADHFKVRIEMKQIGARQEAGKVGGIGTCGRELCCTSWLTAFASVSTNAARYQEVSLNPQKIAGQCGKLKCCLNYELKCYIDARTDFPDTSIPLETEKGKAYHSKTDVYRRIIWYSYNNENENETFIPLDVDVVKEILQLNQQGKVAKDLQSSSERDQKESGIIYKNAVGADSISRFEEKRRKKKKKTVKNTATVDNKSKPNNQTPSNQTSSNQIPINQNRSARKNKKEGAKTKTEK